MKASTPTPSPSHINALATQQLQPVSLDRDKEPSVDRPKATPKKVAGGTSSKEKKAGARKVGRPKSVSKDVYCICRGPYDGIEFMIACDRCEEWFHGRCIGMKPQEAKKSNHYYCETCQRIRKMLGVAAEEPSKPVKTKDPNRKSSDKRGRKKRPAVDPALDDHLLQPFSSALGSAQSLHTNPMHYALDQSLAGGAVLSNQHPTLMAAERSQIAPISLQMPAAVESSSVSALRGVDVQQGRESIPPARYDASPNIPSTPVSGGVNASAPQARPTPPIRSAPMTADDDEDEEVCPVCDFQCTCNTNADSGTEAAVLTVTAAAPSGDDEHTYSAIKVPFQPSIPSGTGFADSGHERHDSFIEDSTTSAVVDTTIVKGNISEDDSFRTSHKNPMSTPTSQRRPSILRRSGKGIGKAPYLLQISKRDEILHRRGKSLKGGKAALHLYQQSIQSSGSEMSDIYSEDGGDLEMRGRGRDHCSRMALDSSGSTQRPRARYASDSDDEREEEGDDILSLSSSGTLSDFEEDESTDRGEAQADRTRWKGQKATSHSDSSSRPVAGKRWSQPHVVLTAASIRQHHESSLPPDARIRAAAEGPIVIKKRGPGRPRKHKDPLLISPQDEEALYTPAIIASRKAAVAAQPLKRGTKKDVQAPIKGLTRPDFPFIAYDPDVAEDVAALHAIENDNEDSGVISGPTSTNANRLLDLSDSDDIFGDGDLSDELSGDLSDIPSEDLDDLSDDGLDFSSSDEEDDTSTSSGPREFHYSELEEQDESLVDSDSSINSITSNSSDSTDSASDSEVEVFLRDVTDPDEEHYEYEHEGSEDLIDDEELLRLEEQERLFLAKAHGLHDVFSEEDSDPGRNPFESSDDEDDGYDLAPDEDEYGHPEEFYDDEYYEDDYEEMDDMEILEQLTGVQSDMQALMMIPPEQQEQLLLLQHYAEIHRQQQEQQLSGVQLHQGEMLHLQDSSAEAFQRHAEHGSPVSDLLSSHLLPQFDVHVPDLDAVSEQLAASLASSLASSMAESMSGQNQDTSLFTTQSTTEDGLSITLQIQSPTEQVVALKSPGDPAETHSSVSSGSTPSITTDTSVLTWTTSAPTTPNTLAIIPTPANTPSPPERVVGESLSSASATASTQLPQHTPSLSTKAPKLATFQKGQSSTGKVQTLHNSASYKPLSSIVAVPTIGGRPVQPILPKLAPGESMSGLSPFAKAHAAETQFALLNQTRLQHGGPSVFKEAAQRALGGNSTTTIPEDPASGDTTDDASPNMHSSEFKKRKGDDVKVKEQTAVGQGKRRRLSTVGTKGAAKNSAAPLSQGSPMDPTQIGTLATSTYSPASTSASVACMSSFSTGESSASTSMAGFDFSSVSMPFIDPAARIITPTVSKHPRHRKSSLKGKELKQSDSGVLPMDDLLDTSALYGRSSSRSPSPERAGADAGDGDNEMSQSMLKDLNRWERVPIGTFRKSRRPSSSYVGLQSALKFGNVSMPATLLADHQQQQQLLLQESHRPPKRTLGVRRHRTSSNASDFMSGLQRKEAIMQDRLLKNRQHQFRQRATSVSQSSSGARVGMLLEGFGSQDGHHAHGSGSLHRTQSSFGTLDIPLVLGTNPMRRRKRAVSSTADVLRVGHRANGHRPPSMSQQLSTVPSDLNMDLHTGLGIGLGELASNGITSSKNGHGSEGTGRAAGLEDLMTDSNQLPSSACPTPLHSPLFSATSASGRVHHHGSGEAVITENQSSKGSLGDDDGPRGDDAIVSHLELDIGKEMDGFHERLMAKIKADSEDS
ncbi:PHD finger protein 8 [Mortierella alpina]|uniref:PHD finger protein 8 n=1 Tax=Mortierella alpina TaxID=64518 RepID=A0A9P6M6P3_MORAP|nr:PHD finger protein 8 [Mortierella alpina]